MKPAIKCGTIAAVLALTSACAAQQPRPASTVSVSETSVCQIDRPLPVRLAPGEGVNDIGNVFDTDETVAAILEHNARYRAACPSE